MGSLLLAGLARWQLSRRQRLATFSAAGLAIVILAGVLAVGQVPHAFKVFRRAQQGSVSATMGRAACLQDGPPARDTYTVRLPFINWLRAQMHPGDVYAFPDYTPPPDALCLDLMLLPGLPALPGQIPTRTIAMGVIPPIMRPRIAAHAPGTYVFAPGFALEVESRP